MRYFNIRRSGTIICRQCSKKSSTPMLHVNHVAEDHADLNRYCPFCFKISTQIEGRTTKKAIYHMKFCCFVHKVENAQYRRLFNTMYDSEQNDNYVRKIQQNSILSMQRQINTDRFYMHVIEYELKDGLAAINTSKQLYQHTDHHSLEIDTLQIFHNNYCIHAKSAYPDWLRLNMSELFNIDKMVACNTITFNQNENIDCKLIRIISLHWHKYKLLKYTITYNMFAQNINTFQSGVEKFHFAIAPYLRLIKTNDNILAVSMIIISSSYQSLNKLLPLAVQIYEIENFDSFVDVCYNLSNNDNEQMEFPRNETYHIMGGFDYVEDVLMINHSPIKLNTVATMTRPDFSILKMFCPLGRYAKIYLYAITKYGCVRAFDRLLHRNNLTNHITDVIFNNRFYYINYSSLAKVNDIEQFTINLDTNETFIDESVYENVNESFSFDYLMGKKIFFINSDNIKLVDIRPTDDEDPKEITYFPNCLFGLNIRYQLTASQVTIYKVVQYHREKLQIEINKIPFLEF